MKKQLNTFAYSASQMDWVVRALEKIDSALQEQYEWDETSSHSYCYKSKVKIKNLVVGLEINLLTSQGSYLDKDMSVCRRVGYDVELSCSNSTNKVFVKVCKEFEDILKDFTKHKFINRIEEVELFLNRLEELANFLESNFIEL